MAFDYSGLLTVANTLITDFGRTVSLQRESETAADPGKPWGPRSAVGGESITTIGVFLTTERVPFQGDTTVDEKVGRVLTVADPLLPEEMGTDWKLEDVVSGRIYEIVTSTPVKPGPTLLYYDLEVKL